ncbi:MAG: RRXRR domain-containing protein [Syntrophobacterales bacterium]|nr:RRXRR domain-containing protein [Syntrophobacterales bacterium]
MEKVLIINTHKEPIEYVHPGKARTMLNEGKAAVFAKHPFTIILKDNFRETSASAGVA